MRLNISHTTRYCYSKPVRGITQSMRLTPSPHAGQKIEQWQINTPEAILGSPIVDGAGNIVQTLSLDQPSETIEIGVEGVIETTDTGGVLREHREQMHPVAYLQQTNATRADDAITQLANDVVANIPEREQLNRAHVLSERVSNTLKYETASTSVNTTACQALENGRGVCQDYAHLLIAACGVVDLPARYISGYLFASDMLSPEEASHAWAEVFVDDLGWVGFDPANHCCADDKYVRLAAGLDAIYTAPIRGRSWGVSHERLEVKVAVQAMQQ